MNTKKRRCGFCGKMPLNGINVLLIVLICVILYVFNHFEMKQHRTQKAQEKAKAQFEKLTDECFLHNNHQSCEILKTLQ